MSTEPLVPVKMAPSRVARRLGTKHLLVSMSVFGRSDNYFSGE